MCFFFFMVASCARCAHSSSSGINGFRFVLANFNDWNSHSLYFVDFFYCSLFIVFSKNARDTKPWSVACQLKYESTLSLSRLRNARMENAIHCEIFVFKVSIQSRKVLNDFLCARNAISIVRPSSSRCKEDSRRQRKKTFPFCFLYFLVAPVRSVPSVYPHQFKWKVCQKLPKRNSWKKAARVFEWLEWCRKRQQFPTFNFSMCNCKMQFNFFCGAVWLGRSLSARSTRKRNRTKNGCAHTYSGSKLPGSSGDWMRGMALQRPETVPLNVKMMWSAISSVMKTPFGHFHWMGSRLWRGNMK